MAFWSAENATNAFLNTLMGQDTKEPNEAEFISALAAGNNSQLMILIASQDYVTNYTVLTALSAAANQTNSRVVCIFTTLEDYKTSIEELELHLVGENIDFMIGNPQKLMSRNFKDADFVLMDCETLNIYKEIIGLMEKRCNNGAIVVGYNALNKGNTWQQWSSKTTHLLPIGRGLLVTRITSSKAKSTCCTNDGNVGWKKNRSKWVVKVDQSTGEEHVFRVRIPQGY